MVQPEILDLGRMPYAPARDRMLRLAEGVRKQESGGNILLVEHDPVLTAGRATAPEDLVGGVIAIERGGKITYHGPGQLVVYPVVRLPSRDVRAWLRRLERFGCALCQAFGLDAQASVDGTGVFVRGRKLISIGVAIRHWVNLHGLAINVDMPRDAFQNIRPCGLDPAIMTDLTRAVGRRVELAEVKRAVRDRAAMLTDPEVVA